MAIALSGRARRFRRSLFAVGAAFFALFMAVGLTATAANATTLYGVGGSGSAYYRASAGIYSGSLEVESAGCVRMERKTSAGAWVTSGFHKGSASGGSVSVLDSCAGDSGPSTWHIVNPSAVYGLRFVYTATGAVTSFCTNQTGCTGLS